MPLDEMIGNIKVFNNGSKQMLLKPITIFALILIASVSAFGQTYHPFPEDSATWSVEDYFYNIGEPPDIFDDCIARHYGLVGDTIIKGNKYSKLYGNNLQSDYPYNDSAFNFQSATYVAAVREDSQKRVWIREPTDTSDILYYDFSLVEGDTFCFEYFNTVQCHQVVSVDSILVDSSYREQIHFQPGETWIEGIGSTTGWFQWQHVGSISHKLLCFHQGQKKIYGGSRCHCDTFTGSGSLSKKESISVTPNPAIDHVFVELGSKFNKQVTIDIYSVLGVRVRTVQVKRGNMKRINVEELNSGIYLLSINDSQNNRWTQRLLIK